MKSLKLPVVLFGGLLTLAACSDNGGTENVAVEETVVANDTATIVSPKEIPGLDVNEKTGYLTFKTADDAIKYMNSSKDSAAYAQGILHQMAKDYLPYAEKLLNNTHERFIIVDKQLMRVRLFDKYGRMEKDYATACAKNYGTKHQKADSRTPEGFFEAEGIYDSTKWLFTNDRGYTSPARGQFGPRFIRLQTPITLQIGIHGTAAPGSLGKRVSHGCIRIHNDNIMELHTLVDVGTPIIVTPSIKDTQVNIAEGYDIPWISSSQEPRYERPEPGKSYPSAAIPVNKPASTVSSTTASSSPATAKTTEKTSNESTVETKATEATPAVATESSPAPTEKGAEKPAEAPAEKPAEKPATPAEKPTATPSPAPATNE